MTSVRNRLLLSAAGSVLIAAGLLPPALAQDRVGVASAVNPAATGQPPGLPVRTILVGNDVVFNERVATQADGQAQLLFLDRSAFSIGPNSEVVIDEFVYDKGAGTGKLVASAAKGVFRFVGGALSKNEDGVSIKTPTATIGIRGGVALVQIGANGATTAIFLYGKSMTVVSPTGSVTVVRPGFGSQVGPGGAPSAPFQAPSNQILGMTGLLDGRPGADGGAGELPTGARIEASGLPQTNSANVQVVTAESARGPAAPPPPNPASVNQSSDIRTAQNQNPSNQTSSTVTFDQFAGFLPDFTCNSGETSCVLAQNLFSSPAARSLLPVGLTLTPEVQLPAMAAATYNGSIVGAVLENGVNSIVSGSYSQTWNFGARSGTAAINNFGGRSLTGELFGIGSTPQNTFFGSLSSSDESTLGSLSGQFYNGADGTPAKEAFGVAFLDDGTTTPAYQAFAIFRASQSSIDPNVFVAATTLLMQQDLSPFSPTTPVTPAVDLPTGNVTFSYSGSAIASVQANGGSPAIVNGSYSGDFNFGTRTGSANLSLGPDSFSGLVQGVANTSNFRGALSTVSGSLANGVINGSFFNDGSGNPARTQAGNFNLAGPNYLATGRFSAPGGPSL